MALFTNKADAKRPILTKVAQLDISDTAEVASFVHSQGDSVTAAYVAVYGGDKLFPGSPPEGLMEGVTEHCQKMFEVLRLAQRVMESVGRHGRISGFDLSLINQYDARIIYGQDARKSSHMREVNDAPDGSSYISITALSAAMFTGWMDRVTNRVMHELRDMLDTAAQTGKNPIGICPECDYPFVLSGGAGQRGKEGQIYCSYRCSHRVTVRANYGELFPDTKTPSGLSGKGRKRKS